MTELKQYAAESVHKRVMDIVKRLRTGTLLDVPSGQGSLSKSIEDMGFRVFGGDIEGSNILYRNGRNVQLDLNVSLPFRDGVFDCVVCVEGIEHLENPHQLVRECRRVLKDGGYFIVSTPNVMTIKSRLRFLFYSYLDFFRYYGPLPRDAKYRVEEHEHQHINPVPYGELRFILEKCGLAIETVETNRAVRKWGLVYPLVKWLVRYKTRKRFPRESFYVSDTLLEGEELIFVARAAAKDRFAGR
jgi:SAM-dependent methyltransferase